MKKNSNDALSISQYIAKEYEIKSLVKLQKILYFTYLEYLSLTDKKLFEDVFEAWVHGPVVRKVFKYVRENGNDMNFRDSKIKKFEPNRNDREIIKGIIDEYIKYEADELILMSHQTEPWKKARNGLKKTELSQREISFENMSKYATNYKTRNI